MVVVVIDAKDLERWRGRSSRRTRRIAWDGEQKEKPGEGAGRDAKKYKVLSRGSEEREAWAKRKSTRGEQRHRPCVIKRVMRAGSDAAL